MIPLSEEQFEGHAPVFAEPLALRVDFHAFGDFGGAGRQKLGNTCDLNQAKAAGADIINAFEMAEGRDRDAGIGSGFEDGGGLVGANVLAVDD
jgi:hypothetical protein